MVGVKVGGGVKVWGRQGCGQGMGSGLWDQGQGYDRWSQSRGQCRGSKSVGQCQGINVWRRGHGQGDDHEGQGLGSWGKMVGWVYCGGRL